MLQGAWRTMLGKICTCRLDCTLGVTVKDYCQILVDTLPGRFLPAWTRRVTGTHLGGLRAPRDDQSSVHRSILVCLEEKQRQTADDVEVLPVVRFLQLLWTDGLR